MHFFKALLVGAAAFAGQAAAQTALAFTSVPSSAAVGQAAVISYTSSDLNSPVTITLRKGNPLNLDTIGVLTSSATGGSYTWVPDSSLAPGSDYALQITQGNQINYSGQFPVTGGTASAVSSAQSVTSASASSASSVSSVLSVSSVSSLISAITANSTVSGVSLTTTTSSSVAIIIANVTSAASGAASSAISRNTTMSMATLTASTTTTAAAGAGSSASSRASSSSSTRASSAPTSSTSVVPSNDASGLHSPLALIFGAVAAMIYLN